MLKTQYAALLLFFFLPLLVFSSDKSRDRLHQLHQAGKYEKCLSLANDLIQEGNNPALGSLFRAKVFYENGRRAKDSLTKMNWRAEVLSEISRGKAYTIPENQEHLTSRFFRKVQRNVFSEAERQFDLDNRAKANELFDALFEAFPEHTGIYKNENSFPEEFSFHPQAKTLFHHPRFRVAETILTNQKISMKEKKFLLALNLLRLDPKHFYTNLLGIKDQKFSNNFSENQRYKKYLSKIETLSMLKVNELQTINARCHSQSMHDYDFFSHDRHPKSNCGKGWSENCCYASYTLSTMAAMKIWFFSEGHMMAMLRECKTAGIGFYPPLEASENGSYATLILGN